MRKKRAQKQLQELLKCTLGIHTYVWDCARERSIAGKPAYVRRFRICKFCRHTAPSGVISGHFADSSFEMYIFVRISCAVLNILINIWGPLQDKDIIEVSAAMVDIHYNSSLLKNLQNINTTEKLLDKVTVILAKLMLMPNFTDTQKEKIYEYVRDKKPLLTVSSKYKK